LFLISVNGLSQSNSPLNQSISIQVENVPIKKVLKEISKKYKVDFSYSSNIVPVTNLVTLNEKDVPLNSILDKMFSNKNIDYQLLNGKIILLPKANKTIKYTISGRLIDAETNQTIPGAIVILDSNKYTITTYDGVFLFAEVSASEHQLVIRMLGYQTVVLAGNNFPSEIKMESAAIKLEQAIIIADAIVDRTTVSDVVLSQKELNMVTGFANDPLNTVATLPGISSKGGVLGSSQLFVKGGDANEALYFLDNAPVYWPWYFFGKSVFNVETIEKAEILTGGFPASYGNSMSAIFNMKSKDGSLKNFGTSVSAGFYDFQATIEGPIVKNKVSLLVSGRRSYLDLIINNSPTKIPSFSDITYKITWNINSKNKISFSGLNTYQFFRFNKDSVDFGEAKNVDFNGNVNTESLQWQSTFSDKWYNKLSLSYSSLQSKGAIDRNYNNKIFGESIGVREDVTHFINAKHKIKGGFEGYFANLLFSGYSPLDPLNENSSDSSVVLINRNIDEKIVTAGAYFLYEGYLFKALRINTGIRTDYQALNKNIDLSPRLSLGFHLTKKIELRAATGIYYQPADIIGIKLNPTLKSNKSIHYISGINYNISNEIKGWVEGFYKDYDNLVVFDSLLNYTNSGFGSSKGVALIIKKESKKLSGWVSYTYSISKRKNSLHKKNNSFFFDQPHLFNVVVSYNFTDKKRKIIPSLITLDYHYKSGTPFTPVIGATNNNGSYTPITGETLSQRNKSFNTLNVKVEWRTKIGKRKRVGLNYYFQLWNLLSATHFEKRVSELGSQYSNNVNEIVKENRDLLVSIGFRIDFNRPLK
ncbi:MAG: TonB-dependent receptor, partial [Flavobacteriales bacterium]|nr:TonB-dependent receptor [Flavobacteriales bacterium]